MSFTVPNKYDGISDEQSVLFSQHLQILVDAISGVGAVVTGCAVSSVGGMNIAVDAGSVVRDNVTTVVNAASETVFAGYQTAPRLDIVVVNGATAVVRKGVPQINPMPPALQPGDIGLALIYVPATAAALTSGNITDLRVLNDVSAFAHISSTANPHAVTAAQAGADPAGTAAAAIVTHKAEIDPHPGYLTPAEGDAAYEAKSANIQSHISSASNPHAVTAAQVGLGNVDNTSDANKPVSTAQQTALNLKSDTTHTHTGVYEPADATILKDADIGVTVAAHAHGHDATYAPKMPGEPNGFVDRNAVTIAFDNLTRTYTLTGTYDIWADGNKYSKTGDTLQISDVEGSHHLYYNSAGVLTESVTFSPEIIHTWCYVSSVYWDATNAQAIPWAMAETHGAEMPAEVHSYLHATQGTKFVSGMAITLNATGNGSQAEHAQFISTAGAIRDEDIPHTVLARTALTDNIRVLYRLGTSTWRMGAASSYPALVTGSGRAAYNLNTAGTWSLAEAGNGNYILAHVYAMPGTNHTAGGLAVVMGQAQYANLTAARDGADSEAAGLQLAGLPSAEFKLIATLIVQTSNTYSNAVKSRFVQFATGVDYVDWRLASPVPSPASSGGAWGSITGTLSDQTDLQTALNSKASLVHAHVATDVTDFASAALIAAPAETATTLAVIHSAATAKETPADADEIPLIDSAATWSLKKLTWAQMKATLKTWLESATVTLSNKTLIAPALGTPASGTLTNCTGLPAAGVVDTAVTLTATQTLSGKTLTSPTVNGGAINAATIGATTPAPISCTTLMQSNRINTNWTIPDGFNALTITPFEINPDVTVTGLGNSTWKGI